MTMHKALHMINNIDRLHVSTKEGGKGLACTEDGVDASTQGHADYTKKKLKKDYL